ncbi:MAG: MBL fold metallo-hydrolase [Candidatus Aenigmarchaeota archaeon]|nr:MBL fold metallo-hydrolase [Candidatus Aenigmarchaeota archaeon]
MADFKSIIWSVEHGSAAFVICPNGKTIMLDAGKSKEFFPAYYLRNQYNTSQITQLIISHPHRDHIEDLPDVIKYCKPKILRRNESIPKQLIYPSDEYYDDEVFQAYKELDETYTSPVSDEDTDTPISNWGNVEIKSFYNRPDWLTSPSLNNLSLLTVIRYQDVEIVFPGDLEPIGWETLLNNTDLAESVGKSSIRILVAPHHGRKTGIRSSTGSVYTRFLEIMKPHLTIISDKWGNETTDPEAYRYYCLGMKVYNQNTENWEDKKIITTKTNDFVLIACKNNAAVVMIG